MALFHQHVHGPLDVGGQGFDIVAVFSVSQTLLDLLRSGWAKHGQYGARVTCLHAEVHTDRIVPAPPCELGLSQPLPGLADGPLLAELLA